MSWLSNFFGGIFAPITSAVDGYNARALEREHRQTTIVEKAATWEAAQAAASKDSWKDEYLTIILSAPFILHFIAPWMGMDFQGKLEDAMTSLGNLPGEYWYLMATAVAASFGIKGVPKAIQAIRSIKGGGA